MKTSNGVNSGSNEVAMTKKTKPTRRHSKEGASATPEWYPEKTKERKHKEELLQQEKTAKALNRIPKQLRNKDFRFVKIRMKGKGAKKRPFPDKWQTKNNYRYDNQPFLDYIVDDNNFGVLCGCGDLAVIDADEKQISELVEKKLPKTFTVQTGGGGRHFYFIVPDMEKKKVLYDKNHKHYGEIQFTGAQVVAPGCIHPNNNRYEIVKDVPIKTISFDDIKQALKDYFQTNVTEPEHWENGGEFEDVDITKVLNLSKFKRQGQEYQGVHPIHGSKTKNNFCVNPTKGTWHCFRCNTGGGALSLIAVLEGIIDCSDSKPGALKGDIFKQVVSVADEKYNINIQNRPNTPNQPHTPHTPHTPHLNDKEYLIKHFLSKEKRPYENIGRGLSNNVCYIGTYVEDDDGKSHTAVVTSDRKMYIDLGKGKNQIKKDFNLHYREEFYWEILETTWSNEIINKWLYDDYAVDIKDIFKRLVDINRKFIIYEDPRIHICMGIDVLKSFFFFLFNANSRTHHLADPASGKTNQMMIFRAVMFNPIASPDFSSASLYRSIEGTGGTILVDDFDDVPDEEKQRINRHIKVHYKRFKAVRSDGGKRFRPQGYDAYSHFVFNNTTGIADKITQERVVTYRLLKHPNAPKFEVDFRDLQFKSLRDDLYICLLQYWKDVKQTYDGLKVDELKGRDLEIFKPQLAIAKIIGKDVYNKVLSFALEYVKQAKEKDLTDDWEYILLKILWKKLKDCKNENETKDIHVKIIADDICNKLYFDLHQKDKDTKLYQLRSFIGGKLSSYIKFKKTIPHGYAIYHVHKKGLEEIIQLKNMPWLLNDDENEGEVGEVCEVGGVRKNIKKTPHIDQKEPQLSFFDLSNENEILHNIESIMKTKSKHVWGINDICWNLGVANLPERKKVNKLLLKACSNPKNHTPIKMADASGLKFILGVD